ncbi:MAG TPA: AAA family ATPase [Steroidobacteraceae bacterium]|nr:AAA family ATPase [Steroidobacteraceae bacterium]HQW08142.1 AAA family ATPase [Steroidobacteraceae bacterium]HQX79417.1 AAA family ATPase [Steroidobacteraceae bacterium]
MYLSFFGLNEKPFSITPDPRYLYLSERHAEALAHLLYGVSEAGGFVQLTGEVGTGKTTIVRSLLGQIPKNAEVALILNPRMTAPEFMLTICEELGIGLPDHAVSSLKDLVDILNHYLLRAHADGRRVVLLVDEAQNLAPAVLEQVRLLTNLETPTDKLLQIILIGQPELREMLARPELRQLAQRITGRYHLDPLSSPETAAYARHRLRVAGATSDILTNGALTELYRQSGGIPRLINVIADRALLGAYTQDRHKVTAAIIRSSAGEVFDRRITPRWLPWAAGLGGAAVMVLAMLALWQSGALQRDALATPQAHDPDTVTAQGVARAAAPDRTAAAAAAAPLPAPTPPAHESLVTLLAQHAAATTTDAAFSRLLARWGAAYAAGAGDGCAQAERAGLQCVAQRGSYAQLRLYNRPAMLTLGDDQGGTHQVVLVALGDDDARLDLGGVEYTVRIADLARYWFGDFVLLWRPVAVPVKPLSPGMSGEEVLRLRQHLERLAGVKDTGAEADRYDASLVQLVESFQRQRRLDVDGIAGWQTQLALDNAAPAEGTPLLVAGAEGS